MGGADTPPGSNGDETMIVYQVRVCFTNHSALASYPQTFVTVDSAVKYLEESPANALVITDADAKDVDSTAKRTAQYVLCGASGGFDNYFYGSMPSDDPNDACGGDITARVAVNEAVEALFKA